MLMLKLMIVYYQLLTNNSVERKKFFNELNVKIMHMRQANQEQNFLIGGDYNCTLNNKVDRRLDTGLKATKSDIGNTELTTVLTNNLLEDVWRRRNPGSQKYTFYKKNSKSASRIDFWLI